MSLRILKALGTALVLLIAGSGWAEARDLSARPFTNLYVFGDSLSDSGNLFAATQSIPSPLGPQPPSPPYFQGRFSDGPVWVESLALLLDLEIDFDTNVLVNPLANNQAHGGAFTGTGSLFGLPVGLQNQIDNFAQAGGRIGEHDLVIVWAGANNYLDGDSDTAGAVADLARAILRLSELGARRFLVPNLPDLGSTPLGPATDSVEILNALTASHNARLAKTLQAFRLFTRLEVALLDVNTPFRQLLTDTAVFGFDPDKIGLTCIVQMPDGTRPPSGLCPPKDGSLDSTGFVFWDLVHPTGAAHRQVAIVAHATLVALQNRALRLSLLTAELESD